ncbi:hypothetical protein TNCV_1243311 [Trichonephila clavipes]|nr:hypothetical protein TNCV_1243311 [Trichonephila clavipes]
MIHIDTKKNRLTYEEVSYNDVALSNTMAIGDRSRNFKPRSRDENGILAGISPLQTTTLHQLEDIELRQIQRISALLTRRTFSGTRTRTRDT